MKQRIILHLGMHKTATTFLQKNVYPYLGNVYADKDGRIRDILNHLTQINPVLIDLEAEKKQIQEILAQVDEPAVLISDERLFGNYEQGYFNNKIITDMLAYLFPEAQVFIGFRKQDDWLESIYHQGFHVGRNRPLNQFLNYKKDEFLLFRPMDSYHRVMDIRINPYPFIQNYMRTFGEKNVFALPYELFNTNMQGFLDAFYQFFELEAYYPKKSGAINRSYSLISCYIASYLNPFLTEAGPRNKLKSFLKKTIDSRIYIPARFINDNKRAQIMALHRENNLKLSELIGMDLGQYGYY